jgi:hypothetical protein
MKRKAINFIIKVRKKLNEIYFVTKHLNHNYLICFHYFEELAKQFEKSKKQRKTSLQFTSKIFQVFV